jgi:hypothetical protein
MKYNLALTSTDGEKLIERTVLPEHLVLEMHRTFQVPAEYLVHNAGIFAGGRWAFPNGHAVATWEPAETVGRIVLTVNIDPATWNVTYGDDLGDSDLVREVAGYVQNQILQSAAGVAGAITGCVIDRSNVIDRSMGAFRDLHDVATGSAGRPVTLP